MCEGVNKLSQPPPPPLPPRRPYTSSQYFIFNYDPSVIPTSWQVSDIVITVSQLSPSPSNVDLFVVTSTSKIASACPGYLNYDQQSVNAPPLPQTASFSTNTVSSPVYIAVSGFTPGNNLFSISVMGVGSNIAQPLTSSVPVDGFASISKSSLYSFSFTLTVRAPFTLFVCLPVPF